MRAMRKQAFNTLSSAILAEIATIRHEPIEQAYWDDLGRRELREGERAALGIFTEKLAQYKAHRVNEATIWARAIYPLLMLAERGSVRAWSLVPLSATFDDLELSGEADGALAVSVDEEIGLPYLVVMEAKRGTSGTDPVAQLFGAMLCAARLNELGGHPGGEIYGSYTIADVWTFVRGRLDASQGRPVMSVLSSREYWEKTEATTILAILESIVGKFQP
jgi:hypothetical protein